MKVRVCMLTAVTAAALLSGCDTYEGQGAAYGAGAGAIIGGLAGDNVRSAAAGAAAGAATGALIGAIIHENERSRYYQDAPPEGYPYGRRTEYPALVRSPYYPHNLIDVRGIPPGALVLELYEHLVEGSTVRPTFYVDFPTEVSPLTRAHRETPGLTEKWDLYVNGFELATAYSELVDPVVQRERLVAQSLLAAGGDAEAMQLDEDFLRAMEYGMPPTGGMGMGIDRLLMALTGLDARGYKNSTLMFTLARIVIAPSKARHLIHPSWTGIAEPMWPPMQIRASRATRRSPRMFVVTRSVVWPGSRTERSSASR